MPKTPHKPRIALAIILKDDSEYKMVARMLESFMPFVDGLYAAITGPSGKHQELIKLIEEYKGTALSCSIETNPEIYKKVGDKVIFADFSAARTVSFDMVPEGYDFLLWADADDVLLNGEELAGVAEKALELNLDAVDFTYWYAVDQNEDGGIRQVIIEQYRERLLKPGIFKWVSRLHEVAVPIGNYKPRRNAWLFNPAEKRKIVWVHLTEAERIIDNVDRNQMLLEWELEDTKWLDPRPIFYLAKVYFDRAGYAREAALVEGNNAWELIDVAKKADNKALELLEQYNKMSGWEEERSSAIQLAGTIYARNKKYQEAIEVFHEGIKMHPNSHLNHLRLVNAYYITGQKEKGDFWLGVSDKLPAPSSQTIGATVGNSFEIKLLSANMHLLKAQMEEKIDEAKAYATIRAELMGEDDGVLKEVIQIESLNTAVTGMFNLSKWLKDNDYVDSVRLILECLPTVIKEQQAVAVVVNNILPPTVWPEGSIVYFASGGGPHFERWGPENMKTGIGGSETAVIRLSQEWAKAGRPVTVYCDCGDQEGMHDGVLYKQHTLFNYHDEFDTLILWRSPHLLDREFTAKNLLMDLHDTLSPLDWTKARVEQVDKVMFKSKYHRDFLPDLPDEKVVIISNGIDE